MNIRREDIDYITDKTRHSVSFLTSLGYTVDRNKNGKTRLEDQFHVRKKGVLMQHYNAGNGRWVTGIQRKFFFEFASNRHNTLRLTKSKRSIEGYID